MKEKIDLFSQLSHYHEQIGQIARDFKYLIDLVAANEVTRSREHFSILHRNHFINHFRLEELVIFPAITIWSKEKSYQHLITDYLLSHEELLAQCNEIITLLATDAQEFTKEQAAAVVTALGKLHAKINSHALHENRNLIPLLAQHSTLRFLSGRNLALLRTVQEKNRDL